MTGLGGRGTAVVTGASSGIGGEFARQLAGRGHAVVIVARRRYRLEKLAAELTETGAAVEILVADLTRSYDVGRVAERAARSDVTVLVNSAGINGYGPFLDAEPLVIADAIALNVTALTLLCRAAITGMAARSTGPSSTCHPSSRSPAGRHRTRCRRGPPTSEPRPTSWPSPGRWPPSPRRAGSTCRCSAPGGPPPSSTLSRAAPPVSDAGGPPDPEEMSAADAARASLTGMDNTEILVVPGLEDPAELDRLAEAEGLLSTGNKPTLARRYTA